MATIHLAECDPEQHPDWIRTKFLEAWHTHNAKNCPETAYMADELYPDETVWVQIDDRAEEG